MIPYSYKQFLDAYNAWQRKMPEQRSEEWFHYCDIRDGLPLGKSKKKYENILKTKSDYLMNKKFAS